ncbi:hypothetical protein ACFXTH_004968 [Malus domestica]
MASMSAPLVTSTTSIIPTTSLSPFSQKYHRISSFGNPRHSNLQAVSCKATNNSSDQNKNPSTSSNDHDHENPSPVNRDRRNVLIGLGSLYGGVAGLGSDPFAVAKPVSPPDLAKCGPADFPSGAVPTNCCPPTSQKIVDFKFPSPTKLRAGRQLTPWIKPTSKNTQKPSSS